MLRRPGSSWGFGALLKGTSVVVLKVERALYIHSPHLQFLPARDSNSQPFDYESNSLTIRPRLRFYLQDNRQITPLTLFKCNVILIKAFVYITLLYTLLLSFFFLFKLIYKWNN